MPLDRLKHPTQQPEQSTQANHPEQRRTHESAEPGTYGEVVAAFDRLKHAWRQNEEIGTVRKIIQNQQKLDEAAKTLQRLGDRVDLDNINSIQNLRATYQERARSAVVDEESKKRLNGWAQILTNYINSTNGLLEANGRLQELGDLTNPLALEGLRAYHRSQQESRLSKIQRSFEPQVTTPNPAQRFGEAKQSLDQQINKNGRRFDLDNPEDIQRLIDGWQRQLNNAATEHDKNWYGRWIKKMIDFQQLRSEHQEYLKHRSTETGADDASAAKLDRFIAATDDDSARQEPIEQEVKLIQRLRVREPRLVQRYVLEESLRTPSIPAPTRDAAETVLRYYTAEEAAKTAEDNWLRDTFGEEYERLKHRRENLYEANDRLREWGQRASRADSELQDRYQEFVRENDGMPNLDGAFYEEVKAEIKQEEAAITDAIEAMKRSRPQEYEQAVAPFIRASNAQYEALRRDTATASLDDSLRFDLVQKMNRTLRRSSSFHDTVRAYITGYPTRIPYVD